LLRTANQFLAALNRLGAEGGILRVAADADCVLPSIVVRPPPGARWTLRAERGASRPRIRFQPMPASPKAPTAWAVWLDVRSGALQLDGMDLVLPLSEAPSPGRWAGFGVWPGAELSLTDCTVTVEGNRAISAALVVRASENEAERGVALPEPSAAQVLLTDSLLRCGGDLVDVGAGHRLDLKLRNTVVATGGCLVHAHGLPRGQNGEPVKLDLERVTARVAGGIVVLESAPGEPELPVADVSVRNSILATTPAGGPLFRVDGQDALTALRDRIRWEGHGVAYHQINTYRRDQSAQVGAVPSLYDRPSWKVAVGAHDTASVHADLKFLRPWEAGRPAWVLRREDVRLDPVSPAASAGADLLRIPSPPPST
jgi:serine/threonine-protein kinase